MLWKLDTVKNRKTAMIITNYIYGKYIGKCKYV